VTAAFRQFVAEDIARRRAGRAEPEKEAIVMV